MFGDLMLVLTGIMIFARDQVRVAAVIIMSPSCMKIIVKNFVPIMNCFPVVRYNNDTIII